MDSWDFESDRRCEGDEEDMQRGLTDAVRASVDEAVSLIEELVTRLLRGDTIEAK